MLQLSKIPAAGSFLLVLAACSSPADRFRFEVSVASALVEESVDGRVLLLISRSDDVEPRFQRLRGLISAPQADKGHATSSSVAGIAAIFIDKIRPPRTTCAIASTTSQSN